MKKIFFASFIFVLILGSVVLFNNLTPYFQPKDGKLTVTTQAVKARVYLDGTLIGTSPLYAKNLRVGNHKISVEPLFSPKTSFRWESNIDISSKNFSVINLDLAPNQIFSAGETLSFVPGQKSLSLITYPPGANVAVDTVAKGKTPLSLNLDSGVHSITIKKDGYIDREITPNVEDGYKLSAIVYLAEDPFGEIKKLDATDKLTLFALVPKELNFSSQEWADGIKELQGSFGQSQTKFDVLIDNQGKTFILDQTEWKNKTASKAVANIGYLAKNSDETLSAKAAASWQSIKSSF